MLIEARKTEKMIGRVKEGRTAGRGQGEREERQTHMHQFSSFKTAIRGLSL